MSDLRSFHLSDLSGGKRTAADQIRSLAIQVSRLAPDHRDPERFHLEKSEVVAELRRLAREVSNG